MAIDRETGKEVWRATNPEHGRWDALGEQQGVVILGYGSCDYTSRQAIVALDRDTGEERWRLRGSPPDTTLNAYVSTDRSAPIVVATVTRTANDPLLTKHLEGIDPRSGDSLWKKTPESNRVVVASARDLVVTALVSRFDASEPLTPQSPEMRGVDRETGETRWAYAPDAQMFPGSLPIISVIDSSNLMVTSFEGGLGPSGGPTGVQVGVDLVTGREVWSVERNEALSADRGTVLLGNFQQPLTAYDPRSREELWTGTVSPGDVARVTPDVVVAYTFEPPFEVVAVDVRTGLTLWRRDASMTGPAVGPVASERGAVYFVRGGLNEQSLIAIDSHTGETLWTSALPSHYSRNWVVGKHVYGAFGGCGS
jgi:outer membrane protein assembly factor BamB